jgi:hypothetical protein
MLEGVYHVITADFDKIVNKDISLVFE